MPQRFELDWFYLPGFTSLVPAHPDSPGPSPGGRKRVVVVVVVVSLPMTLPSLITARII